MSTYMKQRGGTGLAIQTKDLSLSPSEMELVVMVEIVKILKDFKPEARAKILSAVQHLCAADEQVPGALDRFLRGGS